MAFYTAAFLQVAEIEQDGEAIHDILGKMFRRLSKKSPCLDHQDWICVAKNCHGFLKKVLPALDLDRCFEVSNYRGIA